MSNSTVYLDKIYSKDGNTEIVDTVNRSVKAKTIELGGNIIASHSGVEGAGEVTYRILLWIVVWCFLLGILFKLSIENTIH